MALRALTTAALCAALLTSCAGKSGDGAANSTVSTAPAASSEPSPLLAATAAAVSQEPSPSPTPQPTAQRPEPVNGLAASYSLAAAGGTNNVEFNVYINGTKVSTLTSAGNSDITTFMHKGANRIRIIWSQANSGSGKITIGENYKGHWNTAANLAVNFQNPKGDRTIVVNGR